VEHIVVEYAAVVDGNRHIDHQALVPAFDIRASAVAFDIQASVVAFDIQAFVAALDIRAFAADFDNQALAGIQACFALVDIAELDLDTVEPVLDKASADLGTKILNCDDVLSHMTDNN